jgi:hypothetical protein
MRDSGIKALIETFNERLPLILQNLDKNDPEREKSLTLFPQIVFF